MKLLLLAFSLCVAAWADTRLVTVNGDSEVVVAPDKVAIRVGIEYWDKNLQTARKHNEEALKKSLALAEEFKITKENLRIDHIGVEVERKGWNERPMHALEGYYVRRNLTFILKDLTRFDDFIGKLLDAGVNQIHGVEFQTSELRKYRDEARELAMKAAHEKAITLARAVGQKVGKAMQIKEEQDVWVSPYSAPRIGAMNVQASGGGAPTEASVPGMITVRASVSASFQLD